MQRTSKILYTILHKVKNTKRNIQSATKDISTKTLNVKNTIFVLIEIRLGSLITFLRQKGKSSINIKALSQNWLKFLVSKIFKIHGLFLVGAGKFYAIYMQNM